MVLGQIWLPVQLDQWHGKILSLLSVSLINSLPD